MGDINDIIAQGPRPPQVDDPTTASMRGLTLANAVQQRQLQQMQMQSEQLNLQQQRYALDQTRALNQAYQGALTVDADGKPTIDRGKLTTALGQAGHGSAIPGILKSLNEYDQSNATLAKAKGEVADQEIAHAGELGAAVRQAQYDPRLFLTLGSDAVRQGHVPAQSVKPMFDQIQQALEQEPTGAAAKALTQKFTDQLIAASPKQRELDNAAKTAQAREDASKTASDRLAIETPGLRADADQKVRTDTTAKLATATTPAAYTRMYDAIADPEMKKILPAPETWDPKNTPAALLRLGMKPDEVAKADEAAATLANTKSYQSAELVNKKTELAQGAERNAIAREAKDIERVKADPFGALGLNKNPANKGTDTSLHGMEFLGTLPPAMGTRVKAIADGRETLTAREKGSPEGQALQVAVEQYDPAWSEQRAQLRKAFTTGPDGRNIGNLNTVSVHLDALAQAAMAMRNGTFVPGNKLYNTISTMFGGTAPTTFNGLKTVAAGEMASAMKGNATDPEIATFNKSVNDANTPDQLLGVIQKAFLPAVATKLQTFHERYHAQSSPDDQWSPVLPSARAALAKYGINATPAAAAAQPQQQQQQAPRPIPPGAKVQRNTVTGQTRFSTDNGKTWQIQ